MRNSEGYSDPTAQAAFANIMREERKQRREEERKQRREERKQRYNNRPGARKAPKGEKYIRKDEQR